MEIARADGSLDSGYTIAVRGNPDAPEDALGLVFSVIRNAAVGKEKSIEPIGKDELRELAEKITAGVKRRYAARY